MMVEQSFRSTHSLTFHISYFHLCSPKPSPPCFYLSRSYKKLHHSHTNHPPPPQGLHLRANHPLSQLKLLHGSLFNIKCSNEEGCGWTQPGTNTDDPFCPALAAASVDPPSNDPAAPLIPLLDPSNTSIAKVSPSDLPRCPQCKTGLQRPGVVWFGENLDEEMLQEIDDWIFGKDGGRSNIQDWLSGKSKGPGGEPVDMVLVIGTSALVYPAAGYAEAARTKGHTSVVTVNLDAELPENLVGMKEGDFAFGGSADEILPRLLEPVIGRVVVPE